MSYPNITTIRYMGNKNRLLDVIIPEIEKNTKPGDIICDLMAGTNSIGYALKARNRILANDIQYYSYVISKCLLGNYSFPTKEQAHADLDMQYSENKRLKTYNFITENYTDTYFAEHQCIDIDSLRYAISTVEDEDMRSAYLTLLMSAMCKAQSTPGHFAQFMDKNSARVIPLRNMNIYELFFEKIGDFDGFITSKYSNSSTNLNSHDLLKDGNLMSGVKLFYLDSPYTVEQYSRFYHLLETVCKYDYPTLSHKAKYRDDRYKSDFCYKSKISDEFEKIIKAVKSYNSKLIISYSNRGVIPKEDLLCLCQKYYPNTNVKEVQYDHSTQGKGKVKIDELLYILN